MRAPVRRPEALRTLGLWLLLAACVVGWTAPQISIDYRRARWKPVGALLLLPSGRYLDAVSLGFQSALADLVYLWSIQYYGHLRLEQKRQQIWRIFDVITDLDPAYVDPYLTGALIMAQDMADAPMAIRLLEKGAAANPDRWEFPVEIGYYYWMSLGDHEGAARRFDLAVTLPGAPAFLQRLRAALAEQSGDRLQALRLWAGIHAEAVEAGDEVVERLAWRHVYQLRVDLDLDVLRAAIVRYQGDTGDPPDSLDTLAARGYLRGVPRTPEGEEYTYDPTTGQVSAPRSGGAGVGR